MDDDFLKDAILLIDGAMGINIPKLFADHWGDRIMLSEEDKQILADPAHDLYWEVWGEIYDETILSDDEGTKYCLYQDGDLWALPQPLL